MASRSYARQIKQNKDGSSAGSAASASSDSSRPTAAELQKAIDQSTNTLVTVEDRAWAVGILLQDLQGCDRNDTISALASLQALKLYGRISQGSWQLATQAALEVLLYHAHILPIPSVAPRELSPSALEAWRILCNAVKLHDKEAVSALESIESVLQSIVLFVHSPAPKPAHFLASRLLFLLTIKGGETNRSLIEECAILDALYDIIYKASTNASPADAEALMALSEQLKLLYNLAVFYPRLMAIDPRTPAPFDYVSLPASDSRYSPSIDKSSVSSSLGRGLKNIFSKSPSSSPSLGSGRSSRPTSPAPSMARRGSFQVQRHTLAALAPPLIDFILNLPAAYNQPYPKAPLNHALYALSELPFTSEWAAGSAILGDYPCLPTTSTATANELDSLPPLLAKLLCLLDSAMEYTFPDNVEPDDSSNRQRLTKPSGQAQELRTETDIDSELAPILLLIRKCIVGDESGRSRRSTRSRLLSDSMDRSIALDQRTDLTGKLVRLMSSVYFGNTKVGSSELLFVLCDQDPEEFASTLGYGPTAGFLASNQMLGPPPEAKANGKASHSQPINPITGAYDRPARPVDDTPMTEQEKADEAERLFVLFDRLAKTGVINVDNPLQQAQQSGRFEEIQEQNDKSVQEQEEQDERDAIEEMTLWKERRGRR